jgi:hypothetical protein
MLRVHCPRHGQDVLLGHRRVLGVEGHGDEVTVHWVCYCGQRGSHRPQRREPVTDAVAA